MMIMFWVSKMMIWLSGIVTSSEFETVDREKQKNPETGVVSGFEISREGFSQRAPKTGPLAVEVAGSGLGAIAARSNILQLAIVLNTVFIIMEKVII